MGFFKTMFNLGVSFFLLTAKDSLALPPQLKKVFAYVSHKFCRSGSAAGICRISEFKHSYQPYFRIFMELFSSQCIKINSINRKAIEKSELNKL